MENVTFNQFAEGYFCSWQKPESCQDVVLLALKALSFLLVVPAVGICLAYGISKLVASSSEITQKTDEKAQEILKTEVAQPQPEEKISLNLPDWLATRLEGIPVRKYSGFKAWSQINELMGDAPICWVKSDEDEKLYFKLNASYVPGESFIKLQPVDPKSYDSAKESIPFLAYVCPPDSAGYWKFITEPSMVNHRGTLMVVSDIPSIIALYYGISLDEDKMEKLSNIAAEEGLNSLEDKFFWLLARFLNDKPIQVKEKYRDGHWNITLQDRT
jgi:hypothetical protein